MNDESRRFLMALGRGMTADERIILCAFAGDPGKAPAGAWKPWPFHPDIEFRRHLPNGWNGYVTVGAFSKADDGTFRRRTGTCTAGLALMVDDVGTKVPRLAVEHMQPSSIIETSPGNEQWWYFLDEPERDTVRFDGLIRAFIAKALLGNDPGMAGVNRVGRLPGFENAKPQYGGFTTRLVELHPERRFSVQDLLDGFGLEIFGRREVFPKLPSIDRFDRMEAFKAAYLRIKSFGMCKKDAPDPSDWVEIRCPWVDEHTGGIDNGAAIRLPNEENEFYGAFRCHHGSHQLKRWRDLTDWLAEEDQDATDRANDNAPDFMDFGK